MISKHKKQGKAHLQRRRLRQFYKEKETSGEYVWF